MPDYIAPPITTEPDDLAAEAFAYLEDAIPGWVGSPGNLEVWLIESLAQMAGELTDVASAVPTSIFRFFGGSLLNLPQREAVPATGSTSWSMVDTQGYTVPAGTLVGIAATGDESVAFEVVDDVVVPVGEQDATGVTIVAAEPGASGNGLSATPDLIDSLDYVVNIALEGPTGGGVELESDDDYLTRLRELLTLLAPRPILPEDFAVLARTVPGVDRATAIDGYKLDTADDDVERCITVVVADAAGEPVSGTVKAQVDALLEAERELNFLVFVGDPSYTAIDVAFTIKAYPDYDAADVVARVEAAVAEYLSPATFGQATYMAAPSWLADTKVRYLEVAEVVNRVEGVWYVDALTVEGGTADVALTGIAPLPRAGDISGTAL